MVNCERELKEAGGGGGYGGGGEMKPVKWKE